MRIRRQFRTSNSVVLRPAISRDRPFRRLNSVLLVDVASPAARKAHRYASSVSSPTSPSIGGSTSSWKIQQDSYSEALYRHTSAMWEADRRSLERASLDPNAVTSPMQHSSRLSMQLNPPGRPSSVEITGHRRGKSLRVSKQQGISSADLQKDTSRSKSLRRFL